MACFFLLTCSIITTILETNLAALKPHASASANFSYSTISPSRPPALEFRDGTDRVELWDADDFDPWQSLQWETVRVLRYRQYKPDGDVVEAYWLTNLSSHRISRRCLYHMAKSRWHIENEGFNDAKNRYGLEHIRHHHERSLLIVWLLTCLALTLERLYRRSYLHRGSHPVRAAIHLCRLLLLTLSLPVVADSS